MWELFRFAEEPPFNNDLLRKRKMAKVLGWQTGVKNTL
jgi:hypothetical protein